jgi:pimeloyl-ACP methyl ester carboxylesterase
MEGDEMHSMIGFRRLGLTAKTAVLASTIAIVALATPAGASANPPEPFTPPVTVEYMPGYPAPGTPESLDKVGVVKVGRPSARNVLVLEPGTSAGGGYFVPLAKWITERLPGWQVWSVERRENLLEDQSELNLAKQGKATAEQVFNYYLGWLVHPELAEELFKENFLQHLVKVFQANDTYADQWGMKVAVEDLHRVISSARELGGRVVLGGHSLGGSVVTAYATWNFNGTPGADQLAGLVYDDGGSSPSPVSAETAENELKTLAGKSPWLAFGGIGAPFLGLFSALGSTSTLAFPDEASLAESFPLLPETLKPHNSLGQLIPVTNEAEFGYGVNVGSSPPNLIAAQVHAGKGVEETAMADGLHGWNGEGAITPLRRYAEMLSGTGLEGVDGTEWYFPERLTIDTGAVAEGNENPAQKVLEVEATQGHHLPRSLKILAIDTELDKIIGGTALQAAEILAAQSGIPSSHLTLIDRENTYSHNDPAGAYPSNAFFEKLVPFLIGIGGVGSGR